MVGSFPLVATVITVPLLAREPGKNQRDDAHLTAGTQQPVLYSASRIYQPGMNEGGEGKGEGVIARDSDCC